MLIVTGTARVDPLSRAEFIAAATEITVAAREDDGCRSYGFYADLTDTDTVVSIEIWRDRGALEEHMTHSHTQNFLAAVPDLIVGEPVMSTYDVQ